MLLLLFYSETDWKVPLAIVMRATMVRIYLFLWHLLLCSFGISFFWSPPGPHCEFKAGSVPPCDLQCKNGGHCELGITDPIQVHDLVHMMEENSGYKRCNCPDGFGGHLCDVEKVPCGSHHCFNGGTCLSRDVNGSTMYHCDCTSAVNDEHSYAGRFCQYQSTTFCTKGQDANGQLFCVNGGTCKADA